MKKKINGVFLISLIFAVAVIICIGGYFRYDYEMGKQ